MVDKKKTKTKKKTLDPIFNETFIFELPKCQGPSIKEINNLGAEKDQNFLEICRSTPEDKINKSMKLNFIVMDWDLMPPDEVSLKFIYSKKAICKKIKSITHFRFDEPTKGGFFFRKCDSFFKFPNLEKKKYKRLS